MGNPSPASNLKLVYHSLFQYYGPQHWWPAETPFEMMTGAILTQSAAWSNVEKAIANLKTAGVLSPEALRNLSDTDLAALIYPSGYYKAKAKKLKALADWLAIYQDDLSAIEAIAPIKLRKELLSVHGIGLETADSILLYAMEMPFFVIDAYTRRLFDRLGIKPDHDSYGDWQNLFSVDLPQDTALYNEYHALIVKHAKDCCRVRPLCSNCCLVTLCGYTDQAK